MGHPVAVCNPVESDEFDGTTIGPQWQWQGNFNEKWHYCAADKGLLRLFASPVPEDAVSLWDVSNLLLQKPTAPEFTCTTKLTFCPSEKYFGERCGLVVMGLDYAGLVLENTTEGIVLSKVVCQNADKGKTETVEDLKKLAEASNGDKTPSATVWLRCKYTQNGMDAKNKLDQHVEVMFSYSTDGKKFTPLGKTFAARQGKWIGCKTGIFCNRPAKEKVDGGWCDVDFFHVTKK